VVLSQFAPGAEAAPAAQRTETVYVVISGEFTFESEEEIAVLGPLDSVHFIAGTIRSVRNEGAHSATMLVIRPKI
jgi:mannose-6-phosphate isomerase-like protein (cupin superfamily)